MATEKPCVKLPLKTETQPHTIHIKRRDNALLLILIMYLAEVSNPRIKRISIILKFGPTPIFNVISKEYGSIKDNKMQILNKLKYFFEVSTTLCYSLQ